MSHVSLVNTQPGQVRVQAFPALLVALLEKYSSGLWPLSFANMSVNPCTTWIIPVTANPAKFNSFNSLPKLFCLNCHLPTPVCVTDTERSPSSSQELTAETLPKEVT